ncbi:hypothetical protein Godav_011990 [Gossypium davidsonii]|uniref:Uncharacterized protein n=1 Tax=Gossypium davidsonii TaxID=34287 RepID=A0A7J8RBZ0_GOSDV|nr:hypothetical protein [Gossypium davidsonii]
MIKYMGIPVDIMHLLHSNHLEKGPSKEDNE